VKKTPNIYTLESLFSMFKPDGGRCDVEINGKWFPARPLGFSSFRYRCKAAWLVFTGKADALTWPGGQ
jgi:hypothetical protein